MSNLIYLVKEQYENREQFYGKFFTSPYTAMSRVVSFHHERDRMHVVKLSVQEFGVDREDAPCDHIAIEKFVRGFVNRVHKQTHKHGFALQEQGPCLFTLLHNGEVVAEDLIVTLLPMELLNSIEFSDGDWELREDATPVGIPVLSPNQGAEAGREGDLEWFRDNIFDPYTKNWL